MNAKVIGHVWPRLTRCPECSHDKWKKAGSSRGGCIQYRECLICHVVYKVSPIADHVDIGGDQSEIRNR